RGLPEAAIARPFQTFGGEDLYPDAYTKAAALAESLVKDHPFIDGNERTGFVAMAALLMEYDLMLIASQDDAYKTIIDLSVGNLDHAGLVTRIKTNVAPMKNDKDVEGVKS
ncbi:MAG TPA: type II toxin-antitoxin system death-on-curing family toxin, partial [Phnomibacter sp.]|nr:type II toxin-antitoxin system death-on-curing family toxin [Phnomibacter sp.]